TRQRPHRGPSEWAWRILGKSRRILLGSGGAALAREPREPARAPRFPAPEQPVAAPGERSDKRSLQRGAGYVGNQYRIVASELAHVQRRTLAHTRTVTCRECLRGPLYGYVLS